MVGKIFQFEKLLVRINFAKKKLWSEKNLVQKNFWSEKFLIGKKIWSEKKFGLRKNLVGKFLVGNFF